MAFLKDIVRKIWKVLVGAEKFAQDLFPALRDPRFPNLPEELTFLHAEDILDMYPESSAQAARDRDSAEVSRRVHHRHWLEVEGWFSA